MKKIILIFCYILFFMPHLIFTKNITYIDGQPVIKVDELLKIRSDIRYMKLSDSVELYRQKSPLFDYDKIYPDSGPLIIPETFILSIPNGCAYSQSGVIIVDNMYVDELVWAPTKAGLCFPLVDILKLPNPQKIHGKVAVITQGGSWCYYHWMAEVLPRLALLQESGIVYDYLYLPLNKSFMKETIELLGIDLATVIEPPSIKCYIQADDLIVPSAPSAMRFTRQHAIQYLQDKFIPLAQASVDSSLLSKRIFISRSLTKSRKIKNEDEVFALFQEHGFVRYNLEELSFLEQVMLFYNAEIIVGEHGAEIGRAHV